jgi:hypothetical protein
MGVEPGFSHYRLGVFENRVLRGIFGFKRRKWREVGEDCIMRSLNKCCYGDQIKDEMGGTCSMPGRDEKCIQNFGRNTRREETTRKI